MSRSFRVSQGHFSQVPNVTIGRSKFNRSHVLKTTFDEGKLIPDDIMIKVMDARLAEDDCKNGFILDGFPRTLTQAEKLDESDIKIDCVLNIDVPDEVIIRRLSGRLECTKCGTTFHTEYRKPKVDGICDNCGGELTCRDDDKPETVKSRLNVYHTQTEPLIEFYSRKGMLRTAKGQEEIADTTAEVLKALGE